MTLPPLSGLTLTHAGQLGWPWDVLSGGVPAGIGDPYAAWNRVAEDSVSTVSILLPIAGLVRA